MRTIKVKLTGHFMKTYDGITPKGTKAIIDKMRLEDRCASGVMCRIVNIWKRPRWFDSSWLIFDKSSAKISVRGKN